ncbi:putative 2EXR domain-containing protein [Seiridium unicorne]|uniref:2EXR domain-containing protein n=1 Tax=Seiridium unicorne TaxID=138068 RepID=A0ABR2UJA6_9PEZI
MKHVIGGEQTATRFAWFGLRDIVLWPHILEKHSDLLDILCEHVRKLLFLISCNVEITRSLCRVIARLAKSNSSVQVIDLLIPQSHGKSYNWWGDPNLITSPEMIDRLFFEDDVRVVDLRCRKAVRYMDQFFKGFSKLWDLLVARWLWVKWWRKHLREGNNLNWTPNLEALVKLEQWDLKSNWARKTLAEMPIIRPVFVLAKDASWDWRNQKVPEPSISFEELCSMAKEIF